MDIQTSLRDGIEVWDMAENDLRDQTSGYCGHGLYEFGEISFHTAGSLEHRRDTGVHQLQSDRETSGSLRTRFVGSVDADRP